MMSARKALGKLEQFLGHVFLIFFVKFPLFKIPIMFIINHLSKKHLAVKVAITSKSLYSRLIVVIAEILKRTASLKKSFLI